METKIFRTCLIVLAVVFTGTARAQSNEDLKSKIEKMNQEMTKAMMTGNVQANLKFYTDDAISMPNNGPMVKGIDGIRKSNEAMQSEGVKITNFEINTLQVNSSGNMVSEIGTYKMSMTMAGGSGEMKDEGKYLNLWEKQPDGSLKIKTEIWNTDSNPMMQGQSADKK
jgi:uncharacterized protein (TIGR02246 family)